MAMTWNQFAKGYANHHNLLYQQALMEAGPAWNEFKAQLARAEAEGGRRQGKESKKRKAKFYKDGHEVDVAALNGNGKHRSKKSVEKKVHKPSKKGEGKRKERDRESDQPPKKKRRTQPPPSQESKDIFQSFIASRSRETPRPRKEKEEPTKKREKTKEEESSDSEEEGQNMSEEGSSSSDSDESSSDEE